MVDCTPFARCSFRLSLTCTRCPTECRSKTPRRERAGARAESGTQMQRRTRRAMNRAMTKRSTRLLAEKGDPSTHTTRRAPRTWRPRRLGSLRSAPGRLLQRRLRRPQSSPRLCRLQLQKHRRPPPPNCPRLCPGSK
ncbi:hypothetical protein VPH35_046402 [Triticum aestivum]